MIYDKYTNNTEYDYNTTTIQMGFRRKSNDLFESVSQLLFRDKFRKSVSQWKISVICLKRSKQNRTKVFKDSSC